QVAPSPRGHRRSRLDYGMISANVVASHVDRGLAPVRVLQQQQHAGQKGRAADRARKDASRAEGKPRNGGATQDQQEVEALALPGGPRRLLLPGGTPLLQDREGGMPGGRLQGTTEVRGGGCRSRRGDVQGLTAPRL